MSTTCFFFFVAQVASKHGHVDVVRFLLKAHGDQNKAWSQQRDLVWCNLFLGGGFKHFLFSPLPGEMIQFDSFFRWVETTNQVL